MGESVPFVDPFGDAPEPLVMEYPPVTRLQQLAGESRPPYCDCPRMVKTNGTIKVWHAATCTEVLGEPLATIL